MPIHPRRTITILGAGALASAGLLAPARAATPVPLDMRALHDSRSAVIVKVQPRSRTTVVATPSGRLMTIHALRQTKIGTRVQIGGIKWGTTVEGVKWGVAPNGVKWGIKWARNGTYSAKLRTIGTARSFRVRGIVVARNSRAVAVAAPGGVVIVRMAVWLPPGTKSLNGAAPPLPSVGSVVDVRIAMTPGGAMSGTSLKVESTAARYIPFNGTVSALDSGQRNVTIDVSTDPVLPITMTVPLPSLFDVTTVKVGDEVAGAVVLNASGDFELTALGPAIGLSAANDPALQFDAANPPSTPTTPTAPPTPPWTPSAAALAAIDATVTALNTARTNGDLVDATLDATLTAKANDAKAAALAGNRTLAVEKLDGFLKDIDDSTNAQFMPPSRNLVRNEAQNAKNLITS